MAQKGTVDEDPADARALARGRSQGFAIAALALGCLSFVNMLSAEKSILAILFAVIALQGASETRTRRRAMIAIGLALLQMLLLVIVLIVFHDKIAQLLHLLHQLS